MTFDTLFRFLLLLVSTVLLYYFSNRNRSETMNPLLILVSLCTFSLCYLFKAVELGFEIGFGLFAIFSILRFRTRAFNVNVIIFLFSCITLSILDSLYPPGDYGSLLLFQGSIVVAYFIFTLRAIRYNNSLDLKMHFPDAKMPDEAEINRKIGEVLHCEKFAFKIEKVDASKKELFLKVYY